MRYAFRVKAVLPVVLALAAAGCSSYLSGADDDPNNPNNLTRPGPLYISVQALQSVQFEGQLARNATEYVQQIAGNSRQQIGYDLYQMDPVTMDPHWNSVYGSARTIQGGGGLLDIRKMQQIARSLNDSIYIGIGKIYEALVMGMAASIWGDLPYRQAADSNNLTPAFDPQLQVYQDVLTQLDSAIFFLSVPTGGTNLGPPSDNAELVYTQYATDADSLAAIYTEVAHSLKARFHLHLAESDPSHYASALTEAGLGIKVPAHDMLWFHDASPTGQNVWWQFMATRGDIGPGAALVQIMKRRLAAGTDAPDRLNFYFTEAQYDPNPNATGDEVDVGFFGFRPGGATLATAGGIYDGSGSPVDSGGAADPGGHYSGFNFLNVDVDPGDLRIPVITYVETQLIGAEAAFQTGGAGAAAPFFTRAYTTRSYGERGNTRVTFASPTSAPATTLENIMEEKYVALFLNIESWNDYKRTCLPSLAPAPSALGNPTPGQVIPGRLPYGISDINANPNHPDVSPTGRNPVDVASCPRLDYTSTTPRGN